MKSLLSIIFLVTSIISCIKIISTKSTSSALIPFLMVLGIGIVLDLIEELKRYKNDRLTNNTKTKVYSNKKFRNIVWSKINVGNLIKIKKDEMIPADLFVLCTSNKDGSFYLQTASLDGESNLKQREVLMDIQKIFYKQKIKDEKKLEKIFQGINDEGEENCYIEVEQPNKNIYEIYGNIVLNKNEKNHFEARNTAIRGALLKNTNYIYGIVIYTGNDTKIMKNFIKYKNKFAYLDTLIDRIVFIIVLVRVVYVLVFMTIGIFNRLKYLPDYEKNELKYEYIFYYRHSDGTNELNTNFENLKYFTSHFILSQTLLPVSVALLLAITKVIQSLFLEFLEKSLRTKPEQKMKCFSTELLGELGSVKYIFSDKTGTLTKNQTQFKACSIFTSLFDESNDKEQSYTFNMNNLTKNISKSGSRLNLSTFSVSNFSMKFNLDNLLTRLKLKNTPLDIKNINNCPFKSQGEAMEEFILNMSLNHDIVVENDNKKDNIINDNDLKYQGANPDEITLVGAARELGFCFLGKFGNILEVKRIIFSSNKKEEKSENKQFEILLKVPFSSERQRSTIIVRDLKTNKIKLYIKGSDTKIFEKINNYSKENILEITKEHVNTFARRGLRTLCYSFKIIPEAEFNDWNNKYKKIKECLKEDKELLANNLIDEIEENCFLLGATALEDQIQDNVKADIQQFIEAGINFWMLTGDKMDTAESIGHSIKLFDSDTEVYKIKGSNENELIERMEQIKQKIKEAQAELSNLTLDNEIKKGREIDFNTKVNLFKKRIKDKIEIIYEEDDKNQMEINNFKNINENMNENYDSDIRLKSRNKYIENGVDKFLISENRVLKYNESNSNFDNIILNINKEESVENLIRKKNSDGNMSIFKFMIDNQYFENSNVELENLSIIKNKVVQPNLIISCSEEKDKESLRSLDENENYNDNIIINKAKELDKKKSENEGRKSIETDEYKDKNSKENYIQSDMALKELKKEQRIKTNLPTSAKEFLEYFETCVEKSREVFYIQQKAFFLFKLPYLYGLGNNNNDSLTEDIKKTDWEEKLNLKSYLMHTRIKYSLIISGESISSLISEGKAAELFWFLIQHSRSIICCRCSPIQKCNIVQFVKEHSKEITLAIGDGENDVNMIKAADVGIGIFGKEGSQAAFNSDYAFYEFKYLKILLFVYGRFTLLRNTYFLNMFFFKNFLYTFQGIIMTFFSLYSGTFFYDEFYDSMFNTFVSILPLIVFSIIDEDYDPNYKKLDFKRKKKMSYLLPDMYQQTRDSKPFNVVKYIITTIISLIFSIFIFLIFNKSFTGIIKNKNGDVSSFYELIFFDYLAIIIIHFFMVYIDTSLFNLINIIIFFIQILVDLLFIIVMNRIPNDNKLSGITSQLISINHFLTLIISCAIICLPFYILRRMELYFGLNIANLIKTNKLETIFAGKFYKKKIAQMIRATSAVIKFKRILKDLYPTEKTDSNRNSNFDNLIDIKMLKVVKHYEENKKKKK